MVHSYYILCLESNTLFKINIVTLSLAIFTDDQKIVMILLN